MRLAPAREIFQCLCHPILQTIPSWRSSPTSTFNVRAYTDCFSTESPHRHPRRIRRSVLHGSSVRLALAAAGVFSRPSTDLQGGQLAAGELNEFAAWRVEARAVISC